MLASKNKNNKFKKSVAVQNSLHILEFSGEYLIVLYILWQPMINFKCMYQATSLVLPVLPLSLLLLSCYCYWGKPEQAPHWSWQWPHAQNNGIYVSRSVSFTPHLLHPGSWDPCTPWNTLCIPVYWRAHVRDM